MRERILVLDGAMGTMIQALKLDEDGYRGARFDAWNREVRGNNDLLNLSRPDAVRDIHLAYFRAGADIVSTNTFSSTSIAQADYGMEGIAYELNVAGARLAREAAAQARKEDGRRRFVAGALGPNQPHRVDLAGRLQSRLPRHHLRRVARGLWRAGARPARRRRRSAADRDHLRHAQRQGGDLRDLAKSCAERGVDVPVMISGTITDRSGRLLSGQTPAAFWNSVQHADPVTIGLNCALGAREMRAHIAEIGRVADTFVCAYPNAGLPNEFGYYDESPEFMAELLGEFADAGLVNVVGGCCGTTPEHIAAIAKSRGRQEAARDSRTAEAAAAVGAGELHADAGNSLRQCRRAHQRHRLGQVPQADHRRRLHRGARRSRASRWRTARRSSTSTWTRACSTSEAAMTTFLNLIAAEPDIARVPVMVDFSKFSVIEAGLKCLQGKPVVNSISLKEGEEAFIEHARIVRRYGAAVVVMAFDEKGQADTLERKIAICRARLRHSDRAKSAFRRKTSSSIPTSSPSPPAWRSTTTTASISSKRRAGSATTCRTRMCRGGVSNLSFAFRGNERVREAHAFGVPLSRHPRRHGYGHRQRRADRGLRHARSGAARGLRGRGAQPRRRRRRAAARAGGQIPRQGAGGAGGRSRLARAAGGGAAFATRWCRASPISSRPMSRKRG